MSKELERALELLQRVINGELRGGGSLRGQIRDFLASQQVERCKRCDGTGDVHRADGEWIGECDCQHPEQAEGAQGDACDWLESLEGDAWADACEEIAASVQRQRQQVDDAKVERNAFEAHESKERRLSPEDQRFWFRRGAIADYDIKSIDDAWKAWKARAVLAPASDLPMQVTDSGRNPLYEGLFDGETEAQRHERIVVAKDAEIAKVRAALGVRVEAHYQTIAERDTAHARLAKLEQQEPVAWAVFSDSGNVICWSQRRDHVSLITLESDGRKVVPLYATPVAQAGQVPDGWKPVPLEPTAEMLDVAVSHALMISLSGDYNWSAYMRDVWQRMLAAAPQPSKG